MSDLTRRLRELAVGPWFYTMTEAIETIERLERQLKDEQAVEHAQACYAVENRTEVLALRESVRVLREALVLARESVEGMALEFDGEAERAALRTVDDALAATETTP